MCERPGSSASDRIASGCCRATSSSAWTWDCWRAPWPDDRARGLDPIAICANAGASSTGAIDPLPAMADYCESEGIWLHVDATYGGFAAVTERGKRLLGGIERADSVGLDPHKWLFQPYEVGGLLVKDAGTIEHAFEVHHDVLQDTVWGANHPNISDRGLQTEPLVPRLESVDVDPDVRETLETAERFGMEASTAQAAPK